MERITEEKIRIFNKYGGDIDGYSLIGTKKEREELSDDDFLLIGDLLQSIDMINKGVASDDFKSKTFGKIKELADEKGFQLLLRNK